MRVTLTWLAPGQFGARISRLTALTRLLELTMAESYRKPGRTLRMVSCHRSPTITMNLDGKCESPMLVPERPRTFLTSWIGLWPPPLRLRPQDRRLKPQD